MKLINKEIKIKIPKLFGQDDKCLNAVVYVKFFTPDSKWTWYATEFDGKDTFFGLVDGLVKELGYFSLSELENLKATLGLKVEKDLYFEPTELKNFMQ
jgi:hypothetical protein